MQDKTREDNNTPINISEVGNNTYLVFIRDLVLPVSIGIHEQEYLAPQRVRFNVEISVFDNIGEVEDNYKNVICYERLVEKIHNLVRQGHVKLVETLADRVAAICLQSSKVLSAKVRVEKLDIIENVDSVGVEVERFAS